MRVGLSRTRRLTHALCLQPREEPRGEARIYVPNVGPGGMKQRGGRAQSSVLLGSRLAFRAALSAQMLDELVRAHVLLRTLQLIPGIIAFRMPGILRRSPIVRTHGRQLPCPMNIRTRRSAVPYAMHAEWGLTQPVSSVLSSCAAMWLAFFKARNCNTLTLASVRFMRAAVSLSE